MARGLGVAERVRWTGVVGEVAPLLAASDVLLHPTRYDPCSLVVLEALAASVPVIASRADGSSELVGGAGFVLDDPDDAREVGARLEALAEPDARRACAAAARLATRSTDAVAAELLANL
jgi:UDP-glucose:(heptosyl)LPS alpha-1,3-glucosyltransferase